MPFFAVVILGFVALGFWYFIFNGNRIAYKIWYRKNPSVIYNQYSSLSDGKKDGIIIKEYDGTDSIKIAIFGITLQTKIVNRNDPDLEIIYPLKDYPERHLWIGKT